MTFRDDHAAALARADALALELERAQRQVKASDADADVAEARVAELEAQLAKLREKPPEPPVISKLVDANGRPFSPPGAAPSKPREPGQRHAEELVHPIHPPAHPPAMIGWVRTSTLGNLFAGLIVIVLAAVALHRCVTAAPKPHEPTERERQEMIDRHRAEDCRRCRMLERNDRFDPCAGCP